MKTKKLIRLIESHGGQMVKQKGSHRMFKVGGQTICVPYSGSHLDVSPGVKGRILKILAGAPTARTNYPR